MMGKKLELIGHRFGRLVVINKAENKGRRTSWRCKCDCGNIKDFRSECLTRGTTKSCGCLRKEVASKAKKTHGMCRTSTYSSWCGMIQRCLNQNSTDYNYYGGRGITICERWLKFENFFKDMGEKPEGLTIERVRNSDGYEPSNCKWATRLEQAQNTRKRINNTTGGAGITKRHRKYCVRITANNKRHHVGCFTGLEEAIKARQQAEQKYWR